MVTLAKSMHRISKPAAVVLILFAMNVVADELQYVVKGVEDPLKANVLSHMDQVQIGR